MSKIDEYEFRRLGQQLVDFQDDIRNLLNNGKMQFPVITTVPTSRANNGELILFQSGAIARIYGRFNTAWVQLTGLGAPAGTFFSTTAIGVTSNNASEVTLIRGIVGTTSLIANTLSDGRTIRLQAWGYYNTPSVPDNLTMRVKLGGTTVLTTGAQAPAASVSSGGWVLNANIVCVTTGGAGTVFSQGDFPHFNALTYANWPMVNSSTVVINTTGANVVEITAQWAGASTASQFFMSNCTGELLN